LTDASSRYRPGRSGNIEGVPSSHFSVATVPPAGLPGRLAVTVPGRHEWPGGTFVGSLPDVERAALLAAGTPVRFEDDQIMLVQGDTGDFAYVLTGGLVKVVVAAESGVETTLAIRSRGDLVGEFALLDEKPRTATVRAAGDATALRVGGAAFLAVTSGSRAVQAAVTRYVMGKLRETTERRAAERVWDAKERLAQVLFELGRDRAEPGPDGTIRIPLTQSDLGDLAGVAVSTAERILKDLRRQGVVSTRYREVAIKDMAQLESIRFSG
jgi:CRP/FNR family transcriptional regulator, cyclic AMP receptor protein